MTKAKSIKLNFIMNSILTMSSVLFPLISFPYVSRILSPSGIGKVSFAMSIVTYFSMFAQMGIPTYGIRACARVKDDPKELSKTVQEIMLINIITSLIVYVIFFISLFTIDKLQQDKTLFMIISLTIMFNAIGIEWLYRALEEYVYISVRSMLFKLVALILMFVLIKTSDDYVIYGALTILATVGSNILNILYVKRLVPYYHAEKLELKKHLKTIVVFFGMSVATTIYSNLDMAMLGFMSTNEEVGLYSASIKIKNVLISVVTSLGAVLLPRTSYYIKHGLRDEFITICRKALNFVCIFSLALVVFFMMYASDSILFLSGKMYAGSIKPMIIIMPTLFLVGISNITGLQMLVPLNKEKVVLYSEIAGALVNVIVNALLIPNFKSSGAAIGTVIAELTVLLVQVYYLKDILLKNLKEIQFTNILLSLFLASVVGFIILNLQLNSFMTLLCGAFGFFVTYGMILLLMKEKFVMEVLWPFLNKLKGEHNV